MQCPNCRGAMSLKKRKHVTHIGDVKVVDETAMVMTCDSCGTAALSQDDLRGYERRAARLVLTSSKRVSGVALKFARKAMGLRQSDLALVLGSDATQISRWEHEEVLERKLRLAIAALLDQVERDPSLQTVGTNPASELEVQPLRHVG